MNAFHVFGPILACWAVLLTVLGLTREGFPNTSGATRIVATISVVLTILAIGSAIYSGATEDDEPGGADTGMILPL